MIVSSLDPAILVAPHPTATCDGGSVTVYDVSIDYSVLMNNIFSMHTVIDMPDGMLEVKNGVIQSVPNVIANDLALYGDNQTLKDAYNTLMDAVEQYNMVKRLVTEESTHEH